MAASKLSVPFTYPLQIVESYRNSGSVVSGETSYERMKVASGGVIEGTFSHRRSTQPAADDAPLKLVTAPTNPRHVFVD